MINNISTVIVTYNRKELLVKCIHAVLNQTLLPNRVYIVDNASTDGTKEILEKEGLLDKNVNGVAIHYERLPNNSGGAGGFYAGMIPYLSEYDYISPLVIDLEDEKMMAFEGCSVPAFLKREKDGIVKGCANPFNGILYSKRLIDTVGYPKKEMFIWGDEINYDLRAKQKGFTPIMVVKAIHRHPLNRQRYVRYLGQHLMVVPEQDWKLFCYLRNKTYNAISFSGYIACLKAVFFDFIKLSCYFTMQVRQPSKLFLVAKALYKGLVKDFSGLEKYMK